MLDKPCAVNLGWNAASRPGTQVRVSWHPELGLDDPTGRSPYDPDREVVLGHEFVGDPSHYSRLHASKSCSTSPATVANASASSESTVT